MKALSLDQPYATAVAIGAKRFETQAGPARGARRVPQGGLRVGDQHSYVDRDREPLPRGVIVATCQLTACEFMTPELIAWALDGQRRTPALELELELGIWTPGRYAFALADVVRVDPPIPARGRQRLWNFPWPIETHS